MPHITFDGIVVGRAYSRPTLAELWGYRSYHAIARGVVAPRGQNLIVLFVTRDKQESLEQYEDRLTASILHWEGPTDHFAEDRMVSAASVGDELHLFYRDRHHEDFDYYGQMDVINVRRFHGRPSRFTFVVRARNES